VLPRLSLALALAVAFTSLWAVVPAPVYALLPLSVGAPELSVWLGVLAVVAFGLVARDLRVTRLGRYAAITAAASLVLPVSILTRISGTTRALDAEMTRALGDDYLGRVPEDVRARLRPAPVAPLDLLRGLGASSVRVTRAIEFAVNDGVPLSLDVYRPPDASMHPAIIQVYGGGWRSGARTDNEAFSRALAAAGYVVFAIDYRHTPRWHWPAQLDDVRAAMRWVTAHGRDHGGDPARLALFGRSSGAQLAFIAALSEENPAIRAVVLFFSPVNLTRGYDEPGFPDTLGLRALEVALLGGTPAEKPDAYRDASPITYADRPHPPVLLINGGRDRIVYPEYGAALHDHLRRSGTSVFLVIPWANHAFDSVSFGPSAQIALYYAGRFLAWTMR